MQPINLTVTYKIKIHYSLESIFFYVISKSKLTLMYKSIIKILVFKIFIQNQISEENNQAPKEEGPTMQMRELKKKKEKAWIMGHKKK